MRGNDDNRIKKSYVLGTDRKDTRSSKEKMDVCGQERFIRIGMNSWRNIIHDREKLR